MTGKLYHSFDNEHLSWKNNRYVHTLLMICSVNINHLSPEFFSLVYQEILIDNALSKSSILKKIFHDHLNVQCQV